MSASGLVAASRRSLMFAGFSVLFTAAAWLLAQAGSTLCVLFGGIVLATALRPLVEAGVRLGAPRAVAAVGVFVLLGTMVLVAILLAVPLLTEPVAQVSQRLPVYYQELRTSLGASSSAAVRHLAGQLPASPLDGSSAVNAAGLAERALSHLATVPRAGLALATLVVVGVFWSVEGPRAQTRLIELWPVAKRQLAQSFFVEAERRVGAYVRGQLLVSAIVGGLAASAYLMLGLPHALALGTFAAAMEILPIIGPLLGALPALLVALSMGPAAALGVLTAAIVIQLIENHLLAPRILGRGCGVNALGVLLAVAVFGTLFGLAGALVAVPAAAILQLAVSGWLAGRRRTHGNDVRLREEAREIEVAARLARARALACSQREQAETAAQIEALAHGLGRCLGHERPRAFPSHVIARAGVSG